MSFRKLGRPGGYRWDLGLVVSGRTVSLVGDEVAVLALTLSASRHGPGMVALLLVAATLPPVLLAPAAGLLVDRVPARRLVATVSLGQAATCLALLGVAGRPLAVLGLVVALNVGLTVAGPAWQALLPSLVPEDRLAGSLSTLQAATAVAGMLGPALGGLLMGAGGLSLALGVDAVSFLALAAVAASLRGDRVPDVGQGREGRLLRESAAGLRHVCQEPVLRGLVVLVGVFVLALGAVNVAEVFLITDVLGAGPLAYGALGACFAGGVLVGALLVRREWPDELLARGVVGGCVVMTAGIALLGLSPSVWVAAVASSVVGVGNSLLNVLAQRLVIRRTPPAVLGRVFAALQAVVNANLLVSLGAGALLLTVVGPRALVQGAAALTVLALVLTAQPLLRLGRERSSALTPDPAEAV